MNADSDATRRAGDRGVARAATDDETRESANARSREDARARAMHDDDGGDAEATMMTRTTTATRIGTNEEEDDANDGLEELVRALRRAAKQTSRGSSKMASHALAPHCLKALVERGDGLDEVLGGRATTRGRAAALEACEACVGTFTACGSALSAALRDDEQAVYDAYFTAMKMAAFALERADAGRDGDFAARWGDVLRACTSRTYAERWSAKIMERLRCESGALSDVSEFAASEEVALMHALSESVEEFSVSGETSRVSSPMDGLIVELYRSTLERCSVLLRQKLGKTAMRLGEVPRLMAQLCLEALNTNTEIRVTDRIVLECERACTLLGPHLTDNEYKFIAGVVAVFVNSSDWTELSGETSCALASALYTVAVSSTENARKIDSSFALFPRKAVAKSVLIRLCGSDLDVRDSVVKFLEAMMSNDDVNDESHGCVTGLLATVLGEFPDSFLLDERFTVAKANKLILDSAPLTLIRLGLGCQRDGPTSIAECLLATLERAKLFAGEDAKILRFIPAIRMVSFVLRERKNANHELVSMPLVEQLAAAHITPTETNDAQLALRDQAEDDVEAARENARTVALNLQDELGNLFAMPENLLDDNPSDELLESRLARLDAVLDAAVATLAVDRPSGEESARNTLPQLWGRLVAQDEGNRDRLRDRILLPHDDTNDGAEPNDMMDVSSGICTFVTSGESFQEQHWYFCYDCNLVASRGCCSNCAKTCHSGHRVAYSRKSRFFCDCGADGATPAPQHRCYCLNGRDLEDVNARRTTSEKAADRFEIDPGSDSEGEESMEESYEPNLARRLCSVSALEALKMALQKAKVQDKLESVLVSWFRPLHEDDVTRVDQSLADDGLEIKVKDTDATLHVARNFKAGSFEVGPVPSKAQVQELLLSGVIVRNTAACSRDGHLAIAEGDKLSILDANIVVGAQPTNSENKAVRLGDKVGIRPLSRNSIGFEVMKVQFNHMNKDYLAVVGLHEVQICTLGRGGEILDRLRLGTPAGEHDFELIIDASWVSNSTYLFSITGQHSTSVYDLSCDAYTPVCTISTSPACITSSAWFASALRGHVCNAMTTSESDVHVQEVRMKQANEIVQLTESSKIDIQNTNGAQAVMHSETHDVIIVSTNDGEVIISCVERNEENKVTVAMLNKAKLNDSHHSFRVSDFCLPNKPGPDATLQIPAQVFVSTDSMGDSAALLVFDGLEASIISIPPSSASVVGHVGYQKTGSGEFPSALIILRSDGSMQINSYEAVKSSPTPKSQFLEARTEEVSTSVTRFPYDFFEKLAKVTSNVDFGGSFNRGSLPAALRGVLQSDDGYIESANSDDAHLTLELGGGDLRVIRGVRIHVGGMTVQSHAPSKLILPGGRVVKFERESKRWYDVPFTCSESNTIKSSTQPLKLKFVAESVNQLCIRIDRMEVYACNEDVFEADMKVERDSETQAIDDALASHVSRARRHLVRQKDSEITDSSAWLSGTTSIIQALRHCELDLKSSKLRVCYESMLRKRQFVTLETPAHRSAKFIAWKVLSVHTRDNTLTAVNIKDNSTLLFGHKVAERICPRILKRPMSVSDDDLFEFYCAMRKLGRLAIRRPNALLDSSPYLATLANSATAMLHVGAGAWDADEIVPHIVHALIAVLTHERDANLVESVLKLIKSDREDVRAAASDTLLWHLTTISGNERLNLDQARCIFVPNPAFKRDKCAKANGIRDLVSAIMQLNDDVLYRSQATLVRSLSEAYSECLNPDLCKLPPLRGDILEYDAITWRLAIAAECSQLQEITTKDAREAFLHSYALTCELLRRIDSYDKEEMPAEKGYGALLQQQVPMKNVRDVAINALDSTILHASANARKLDLSTLPAREKSEWLQVLARVSALTPECPSENAISMIKQLAGDEEGEVALLVRAGELLNLAPVLRKLVSGNFTSHWYVDEVAYDELMEVKDAIFKVTQVAKACRKSLRYFLEHVDFAVELVAALMEAVPQLPAAFATSVCDLISHIIESYRDCDENDHHRRTSIMREIVQHLDVVVNKCGLLAVESDTRTAATRILKAMWYSCETYRDDVMRVLMVLMESMRNYGHRANELLEFTKSIVMTDTDAIAMFETSIEKFCQGVKDTLLRVSDHPRADLYRALQQRQLLQSDASDKYWLESEPSMRDVTSYIACHEFTDHTLDSLKKSQAFTKNSAMTKLRESMTIQSISMNVTELKRYIHVKEVEVWRTDANKDISSMRTFDSSRWQLLGTLKFSASAHIAELEFEIPVDASALNFVFKSFHESVQAKMMTMLHCPRCARQVTDTKHGICTNCRENAYQCRYCRNINYEKIDAFICSECGHCRYAKIQTTLSAHPTLCTRYPKLLSSDDLANAVEELKLQTESIKRVTDCIESTESSLRRALFEQGEGSGDVEHMFKVVGRGRRMEFIAANYKCGAIHDAILRFLSKASSEDETDLRNVSGNYGVCCDYLNCALKLCTSLSRTPLGVKALSQGDIHRHLFNRMLNPRITNLTVCNTVRTVLSNMAAGSDEVAKFLCEAAFERASDSLLQVNAWHGTMISQSNQDILLLKDLVHASTYRLEAGTALTPGGERSALISLACTTLNSEQLSSNAVLVENTLLPALDLVKQAMTNSSILQEIVAAAKVLDNYSIADMKESANMSGLIPILVSALHCGSKFVRREVLQIFGLVLRQDDEMNVEVGSLLIDSIKSIEQESYADYLSALSLTLRSESIIMKLNDTRKLVDILLSILQKELDIGCKFTASDKALFASTNVDIGSGLHAISMLLRDTFKESTKFMKEFNKTGLETLVRSVLCARTLQICQMPSAVNAAETFDELLSFCLESSESMQQEVAKICVKIARAHVRPQVDKTRLPLCIILNELAMLVLPRAPPSKVYLLRLLKSASQEEFIPGTMARNPYSTAQMSAQPLMRDVKNLICHELEMLGLLEDDFGMELLVSNQIISLDLSVEDVFERIWIPSLFNGTQRRQNVSPNDPIGPPMAVTFRLSGLDGEATEERVDELAPVQEEDEDIETKFAGTNVFQEDVGFKTLIQLLPKIRHNSSALYAGGEDASAKLLEILRSACYVKKNRQHMLAIGALASLLDEAARAFTENSRSGKGLLLVIETLLREEQEDTSHGSMSELKASASTSSMLARELEESSETAHRPGSPRLQKSSSSLQTIAIAVREHEMNHVEIFLSQLKQLIRARERHEADILARVIPRLAGSTVESKAIMAKNFDASIRKLVRLDEMSEEDSQHGALQLELECATRLAEAIPRDFSGQRVLEAIWSQGTVSFITNYIEAEAFGAEMSQDRGSDAWNKAMKRSGLPLALELLNGITLGYTLDVTKHPTLLDLLHKLESVTERDIGTLAENCLETFASGSELVQKHLDNLRAETKEANRRKALAKRQQMLTEMGMTVVKNSSSPGASTIGVSHSPRSLRGYDSMAMESEQDSIVCRVCFEGYVLKPNELLGIYCFNKLASTPSANGDMSQTVCTVSHFNAIHFSCHQSAKRADVALRTPKREWEGAALRNSETLCNNLLPVMGNMVTDASYAAAVDAWWQNCFSVGAFISPPTRARQVAWDVSLLLGRFAMGASFSADCRGGGKDSNMSLLPHLVRLLVHQVSLCPQKGLEEYNAVLARLSCEDEIWNDREFSFSPLLPAALVLSLAVWSHDQWEASRRNALIAILRHTKKYECARIATYPASVDVSASVPWEQLNELDRYAKLKPMLIYFGLVNKMFEWFKPKRRPDLGNAVTIGKAPASTTTGSPEAVTLNERLHDIPSMISGAKDTLEWLDEAMDAEDAQELLDVCEILSDAMCPTVNDFILEALRAEC